MGFYYTSSWNHFRSHTTISMDLWQSDSLVATVYYADSINDSSGLYYGENTYLVYSTDLGANWQSSSLNINYGWPMVALHISPHSCNIIREDLVDGDENWELSASSKHHHHISSGILHFSSGNGRMDCRELLCDVPKRCL